MQQRGVRVVTAGGDDPTATDDPTRIMMGQIAGAFAQYDMARLVGKLRGARNRATAARGYRKAGPRLRFWMALNRPCHGIAGAVTDPMAGIMVGGW